jgi:hypothetical protein
LQAKGISVANFLRSQEELVEKFDSGFSGYRGLSGNNCLSCLASRAAKLMNESSFFRIHYIIIYFSLFCPQVTHQQLTKD